MPFSPVSANTPSCSITPEALARADIVLVSRAAHRGPSFWNSEVGRNTVLNRIVATDLAGIRLEWIRLFVLHEKPCEPGRLPILGGSS